MILDLTERGGEWGGVGGERDRQRQRHGERESTAVANTKHCGKYISE